MLRLLRSAFGLWPDHHPRSFSFDPLRQPPSGRRGAYLAASRRLPAGHVVQLQDLLKVEPKAGLTDVDSIDPRARPLLVGRRLRVERYRYEPFLWSDFAPSEEGGHAHRLDEPAPRP
jgi:hypothetical protein